MLRIRFVHLLIGCALIFAIASVASAQDVASPQKKAAIKELLEVTGVQQYMIATFEESFSRYQQNWAVAVIADLKAKGFFKSLTTEDAAQVEKVITDFGNNVLNEVKRRMGQEVFTTENLITLTGPTYNKYFTEDELIELVAFYKSPTGRKFSEESLKALRAAVLSSIEAKGVYNVRPTAEAELAKVERFKKEVEAPGHVEQVLSASKLPLDHFTEAEKRELIAFFRTPLGKKLDEITPRFTTEVFADYPKLIAPRAEKLIHEVISTQMEALKARVGEIIKKYEPTGRRKQP